MYQLLLVDDEEIALKGLSMYVDWEAMGFQLVDAVYTIAQAKEVLERQTIHVLLTDIQLENESGLDLIEWVGKHYPDTSCVILSGHGDFEYARRALRYGTFDFLTKPVQFDALRKTFVSLKKKLEELDGQIDKTKEYFALKRASVFNRLIGDKNYQVDFELLRELRIPIAKNVVLARLCILEQMFLADGVKNSLVKQLKQIPVDDEELDVFDNAPTELTAVFYNELPQSLKEKLLLFSKNISIALKIGISDSVDSWAGLHQAYSQAGQALDYAFIRHTNSVSTFGEIVQTSECVCDAFRGNCIECLMRKDYSGFSALVEQKMLLLSKSRNCVQMLHSFTTELSLLISRFLRNYLPNYTGNDASQVIQQIVSRTQPQDIITFFQSYILSIWPLVRETSQSTSDILLQIKQYIKEHFMENITLQQLSDVFYLHPNYLSRLFKEKIGVKPARAHGRAPRAHSDLRPYHRFTTFGESPDMPEPIRDRMGSFFCRTRPLPATPLLSDGMFGTGARARVRVHPEARLAAMENPGGRVPSQTIPFEGFPQPRDRFAP